MQEDKIILKSLIDKYNKSKKFNGQNVVNRKISVKVGQLFPKYNDDSNFIDFDRINNIVDSLVGFQYVFAKQKNNVYDLVVLNEEKIDSICKLLCIQPKKQEIAQIKEVLNEFLEKGDDCISNYCMEQFDKIQNNKIVEFYNSDVKEFSLFLNAVYKIRQNEDEIFFRDFSTSKLGDSKKLENIQSQVRNFLVKWCDADDVNSAIENYNIVKNPTSITIKGNCLLKFKKNLIDVSDFSGGFTVSSLDIKNIQDIDIKTDNVITIENLTAFNSFNYNNYVGIFLSGFHNTAKRNFLRLLYQDNSEKKYYHFGDIDAGGFYILQDLINKTSIQFQSYKMDVSTLEKYNDYWKPLTQNDRTRITKLLTTEYKQTIEYMLKNNCKLEQEIININND